MEQMLVAAGITTGLLVFIGGLAHMVPVEPYEREESDEPSPEEDDYDGDYENDE